FTLCAICGIAAGSPGPLLMTMPSGDHDSTSRALGASGHGRKVSAGRSKDRTWAYFSSVYSNSSLGQLPSCPLSSLPSTALGGALERHLVADERIRAHDDLPVVRRVRRDLLVAGHRGVEHDLARRGECVSERLSPPRRTVFQRQDRRPRHRCITIRF